MNRKIKNGKQEQKKSKIEMQYRIVGQSKKTDGRKGEIIGMEIRREKKNDFNKRQNSIKKQGRRKCQRKQK